MPEVGGDLSRSSQIHPATSPRKKLATENVRTYLNKFWSLMKNQPATRFYRINHKFGLRKSNNKKVASTPLKTYSSSRENNQLCIKLAKTDQRQGHFPDRERSKNTISRKAKPKATSNTNKIVSGGERISGHRSSRIVEEGGNKTCSRIKGSICQQHFSETEKWRSFSPDYKFEKIEPIHSIFAFQNGRTKTTKRSSKSKRSNGKNKVSMERESIRIPMSLFWSGTCSQDLHQTFKNSYINSTEKKHSIDNLPRRHSNYGEGLEEIIMSGDTVIFLLQHLSFIINLQKLEPNIIGTKHKTRVFGDENQFGGHDYVPPRGENDGHYRSVQETLIGEKYNPEGINKSNWKVVFDISSSPPGSSTLSLIGNVPDNKAEGQPLLRRQNKSECSLIRGTKVVVQGSTIGVHRVRTYAYFYWRTHDFGHAYILYI